MSGVPEDPDEDRSVFETVRRSETHTRPAIFGHGLWSAAWTMSIVGIGATPRLGVVAGVVVVSSVYLLGPSYLDICTALRQETDNREDGSETDDLERKSKRPTPGTDLGPQSSRFSLDNPGRTFGLLFGASAVVFYSSLVGFVLFVWQSPTENPTLTIVHPVVLVPAVSWASMLLSLVGYTLWSIRNLSRMRRDGG